MAAPVERLLPQVDNDSKPYWDACKQHKLRLPECQSCKKVFFYPRPICPHCFSDKIAWKDMSGEGTIYSYTIARRPAGPAFAGKTPYVVAIIELKEGARMMSNIVTGNVDSVRVGQKVKVTWDDAAPDITLPMFQVV